MSDQRGAALWIVIVTAFMCAVAAYSILFMASSEARRARYFRDRTGARYLAETGLVIAMQQLWADPAYCGGSELVDTDGNGAGDQPVVVTVTNCGANNVHQLQTKVTF